MHCNNCEMVFPETCMLKPSQNVTSFAKLWILPEVCRSAQIGVMEVIKLGKVRSDLYCLSSDQKSSQGREEKQWFFFSCFVLLFVFCNIATASFFPSLRAAISFASESDAVLLGVSLVPSCLTSQLFTFMYFKAVGCHTF